MSSTRKKRFTSIAWSVIAIFVVFAALDHLSGDKSTESNNPVPAVTKTVARPAPQQGTQAHKVTQEDVEFVERVFMPDLYRLANEYPIETARKEMALIMGMVANGEIRVGMQTGAMNQNALAYAVTENGKKKIGFVYVNLRDLYESHDRETVEDYLVGVVTHEGYHLTQQDFAGRAMDPETLRQSEADAWWYSMEKVYKPMFDGGRFRGFSADDGCFLASRLFMDAKGDPNHPAWIQWSKAATGLPPDSF
ncbi:hypothetical protein HN358_04355 [Candidatus Uhrbacteria bacterium]|nr:hypothetical protein [Candidatus Uhrbacteria bacterium]MBT7717016.1 hypothetical protein [Candidatus Uhrbacteria bacterium]